MFCLPIPDILQKQLIVLISDYLYLQLKVYVQQIKSIKSVLLLIFSINLSMKSSVVNKVLLHVQVDEDRDNTVGMNSFYKTVFSTGLVVLNQSHVFEVRFEDKLSTQNIYINDFIKHSLFEMEDFDQVSCQSIQRSQIQELEEASIEVAFFMRSKDKIEINTEELEKQLKDKQIIINENHMFNFSFKTLNLSLTSNLPKPGKYGYISENTYIEFSVTRGTKNIELIDDHKTNPETKNYKFNPQNMKIGGLSQALQTIQRRVFASRSLNPKIRRLLDQNHVRGILLHGPPGTGKTLIAREIGKNLDAKIEIVNGPEIYSENPGKSEEFIRNLFKKAVSQQNQKGRKSDLYCIIIDEIDAIGMKRKLNTSCEVYNLVVNQLLACIDGVTSLSNILVIGTTNRKDMIDQALLRPGRLEVHIEVGIPCEKGRLEILNVHTQVMRSNGLLADNSNLTEIANLTQNYTGAEIQGVVKCAQSHAIHRWRNNGDMQNETCQINHNDLLLGVMEVEPQLGKDSKTLENLIPRRKIPIVKHEQTKATLINIINNLREGKHTILIGGESGVGKTVMAAECGLQTKFDFTRIINADRLIGLNEEQANLEINSIFLDASKFDSSLIILDDLLRLINFIPIGPVFSHSTLNLIINLLRKVVDPSKKQVILATSNGNSEITHLGLSRFFKYCFSLDKITGEDISKVLQVSGFDSRCAAVLSREIQSATVRRLTDVSDIVGAQDSQRWLSYWKLCSEQLC